MFNPGVLLTAGALGRRPTKTEIGDRVIAAMSSAPDGTRDALIRTLISDVYDAGIWFKFDLFYILAAHDEQAGRINWITPGTFTCTNVNSSTFTVDRGYAGNGSSSYLDTNFSPSVHHNALARDSANIWAYQRTTAGTFTFGQQASLRTHVRAGNGSNTGARVNSSTQVDGPAGGTVPIFGMGRRNNSTQASVIRDGVEVTAPTSNTSAALTSSTITFGKVGGAGTEFSGAQMAGGGVGSYLDDTEMAALYTALHTYMVAVGADT